MNEDEFYWNLSLKDGRVIPVPPKSVAIVQRKIAAREPIITAEATIPYSEIKGFDKTSRRLQQQSLLEEVSVAFDEPIITKRTDGTEAVKARWVKKQVTNQEFATFYSKGNMYRRLGDNDNGLIWVAFVVPAHKVDTNKVTLCTDAEIRGLTK